MGLADDLGGTIREVAAQKTLERIRPLLSGFGITRVANITGLDTIGIPVVTVVRPLARSLTVSQGKGVTLELATVSGIMESIEVFHAEQCRPPAVLDHVLACRHSPAFLDPHRLALRTDADLSDLRRIPWIEGEDLLDRNRKLIPEELLNLDFTLRDTPPIFLGSSNGLASGNTRTEAIVHALCEVIERDQTSFWSADQKRPETAANGRVKLETVKDPLCRSLLDACFTAGLDLFVWSISTSIDIPAFVCTIADRRRRTPYAQHATGYGCHPFPTIALSRAITEAAQSRLTHISGLREDLTWSRYREEFSCETGKNRAWLARLAQQSATIDFDALCAATPAVPLDTSALLDHILQRLRSAGLQSAVVVDLAATDEFSIVYVCVPELEYLTPKAGALYSPGPRMRKHLGQKSDPSAETEPVYG
jgi:ribosomal protein S12 methylthiotransferase accessory factor